MEEAQGRWRALARRLVEQEAAAQTTDALAEATERTCARLRERLVQVIGPEGFRILLTNAVDMTRTEHLFLRAAEWRVDADGGVSGLREAVRGRSRTEALGALTAVLGRFMELLAGFIGEALTARLVERTWPAVRRKDRGVGGREKRG